ncbi:SCY1-like protein 2 isoform X3 [Lingula anatina]|uniref:SCY1-like protein 2 isoform X3 n=1 Tax=Lingula anatina TaxID=7574 RepID=A0A2R2MIM2_LINAN|nr:SCY1-like protein 2 isoform X3 [Lingula anatina]|eukprot:XP_023930039.1 SCY1-like protein 2 isoform X3 [Lingula anatina]
MEVFSMIKNAVIGDGTNPITQHFDIGRHVASAGPEMVWKIYDAVRKSDQKEASVFIFDKKVADKLYKPKRKEAVSEVLRKCVKNLERFQHPQILQVYHPIEECYDSVAFASEPVLASLANLLGNQERMPTPIPPEIRDFAFHEMEIKYGILQITEALSYLHNTETCLHGNVCPSSILISKRGAWKLAGMGFLQVARDGKESFMANPWTNKASKMVQPDLDYIAPEVQVDKRCFYVSDMYSMGITICAIHNGGRSLVNSMYNPAEYTKGIQLLSISFGDAASKLPIQLVEPVEKMINRDIRYRPTARLFSLLKFFSDSVVSCLSFLDSLPQKDAGEVTTFYTKTLVDTIPKIPKKILYQHVFPFIRDELYTESDKLVHVIPPLIAIVQNASREEYRLKLMTEINKLLAMPKNALVTIALLEKLDIILFKTPVEAHKIQVLPILYNTLDSNNSLAREAAMNALGAIKQHLDEDSIKKMVLPRAKAIFNNANNVKVKMNALMCIDRLLDRMDKSVISDNVIPFLTKIEPEDPEIVMAITGIFRHMMTDKRCGLTHALLALQVMPSLLPHTTNALLTMEEFGVLMDLLRDMFDAIDRNRRNKMKLEAMHDDETIRGSAPNIIGMQRHRSAAHIDDIKRSREKDHSRHFLSVDHVSHPKSRTGREQANNHKREHRVEFYIEECEEEQENHSPAPSTPELKDRQRFTAASPISQRRVSNHSSVNANKDLSDHKQYSLVPEGPMSPGINLIPDDSSMGFPRRSSTQSLGSPVHHRLSVDANGKPRRHSAGPVVVPGEMNKPHYGSGYFNQMTPNTPRRSQPSLASLSNSVPRYMK